eukprot:3172898-Rhodomonas_salina.1
MCIRDSLTPHPSPLTLPPLTPHLKRQTYLLRLKATDSMPASAAIGPSSPAHCGPSPPCVAPP